MKKKLVIERAALVVLGILLLISVALNVSGVRRDTVAKPQSAMAVYDESELTPDILESRNGRIIIEVITGTCTDYYGNGLTSQGEAISYDLVGGVFPGSQIKTYIIYNPQSNEPDDIVQRYDYVISGGF